MVSAQAVQAPSAFGTSLALMSRLAGEAEQLVVVLPEGGATTEGALLEAARRHGAPLVAVATESQAAALAEAGFDLYTARTSRDGLPTAYFCRDFVCRLPATTPEELSAARGR